MAKNNEYYAPTFDVAGAISRELEAHLQNSNQPQEIGKSVQRVSNKDERVEAYMRYMAQTDPTTLASTPFDAIRRQAYSPENIAKVTFD